MVFPSQDEVNLFKSLQTDRSIRQVEERGLAMLAVPEDASIATHHNISRGYNGEAQTCFEPFVKFYLSIFLIPGCFRQ